MMFKRIILTFFVLLYVSIGWAQMINGPRADNFGLQVSYHEGWSPSFEYGTGWFRVSLKDAKDRANTSVAAFFVEEAKKRPVSANVREWVMENQIKPFYQTYAGTSDPLVRSSSEEVGKKLGVVDVTLIHHDLSINGHQRSVTFFFGTSVVSGQEVWYYGRLSNSGWSYKLKGSEVLDKVLSGIKLGAVSSQ